MINWDLSLEWKDGSTFTNKPYDKLNRARKSIRQNSTSFYGENWGITEIHLNTRKTVQAHSWADENILSIG